MTQPKGEPVFVDRVLGLMLGLAAGSAVGVAAQAGWTADPAEAVPRHDTPDSPFDAAVALAVLLGEELLQQPIALQRLAYRWAEWDAEDGRGTDAWTREALRLVRETDHPPAAIEGPLTGGCVPRGLPVALLTFEQPRNLVSGTYHTAALTHPDETAAWSAVAVNVAAARFLSGHRDFVPDLIEAVRNNGAPEPLVTLARRLPLTRESEVQSGLAEAPLHPIAVSHAALWVAQHDGRAARGIARLASWAPAAAPLLCTTAGALLGARDGVDALPLAWLRAVPGREVLEELALRLARVPGAETAGR